MKKIHLIAIYLILFASVNMQVVHSATDIDLKEEADGIRVQNNFYTLFLSRYENFTVSDIVLREGTGKSAIEKSGISYVPDGSSDYRTEYATMAFENDTYTVEDGGDFVKLIFSAHSKELSIKKTYIVYSSLPWCKVRYDISASQANTRIGPAYLPRIFFSQDLNEITYPAAGGLDFTETVSMADGKVYDEKLTNALQGMHFPKRWFAMARSDTNEGIAVLFSNRSADIVPAVGPDRYHNCYLMNFIFSEYSPKAVPTDNALSVAYYLFPFKYDLSGRFTAIEGLIQQRIPTDVLPLETDAEWRPFYRHLIGNEAFSTWAVPPTVKIYNDASLTNSNLATPQPIELSGAVGEFVSIQLAIKAKQPIDGVKLSFSDLSTEQNQIIEKDNISAYQVEDVNLKSLSMDGRIGLTPDPLTAQSQYSLNSDKPTRIWITVKIPEDALSGKYTGAITMATPSVYKLPVFLNVWDFKIPAVSSLKTAFELDVPELNQSGQKDYLLAYLEQMAQHRIAAVNTVYPDVQLENDQLTINTSYFDQLTAHNLNDLGMNTVFMPHLLFGVHEQARPFFDEPPLSTRWKLLVGQYIRHMAAHFQQKGWQDKVTYFIWDEPANTQSVITMIKDTASFIKGIDPTAHIYVSTPQDLAEMQELINNGISTAVFVVDITSIDDLKDKTAWMSLDGICRDWIAGDLVKVRMLPWIAWAYDMSGLELWSVNAWHDSRFDGDDFSFTKSPTQYYQTPVSAARFGGVLLYPGPVGPVPSIRLESLRDGLQDFEYLHRLSQLVATYQQQTYDAKGLPETIGRADSLLKEIRSSIQSQPNHLLSLAKLTAFRERLGDLNALLVDVVNGRPSPPYLRFVESE